jgi:CheY-like chemotaxis protein
MSASPREVKGKSDLRGSSPSLAHSRCRVGAYLCGNLLHPGEGGMQGSILVVEDDADIQAALSSILRDVGYEVACAGDGREALDRLRAGLRPEVILLDLMMPVMNGAEFRSSQLEDPAIAHIPIVLLTADARIREVARTLNAAAAFAKPFELLDLLAAVARVRTQVPGAVVTA